MQFYFVPLDVRQHVDCSIYIYIVYYILSIYCLCVKAFSHLISVRGRTDNTQSQALKYQSQNKSKHTHKSLYILYIPEGTSHSHLLLLI